VILANRPLLEFVGARIHRLSGSLNSAMNAKIGEIGAISMSSPSRDALRPTHRAPFRTAGV
jgi:hypothetical protein